MADDPSTRTVFVGALDANVSEGMLGEVFSAFGPIRLISVPYGKNCAFVEFMNAASCAPAIEACNGMQLGASRIRAVQGVSKKDRQRPDFNSRPYQQQPAQYQPYQPANYHAQQAYQPAAYAPAPAATPIVPSAAAYDPATAPYKLDQDDNWIRASSTTAEALDANKRNQAFVAAHSDPLVAKLGFQLQNVSELEKLFSAK